jgi:hypothetical protein
LTGGISVLRVANFAWLSDTSVSQAYDLSRDAWKQPCHSANASAQTNNHLINFLFSYQGICRTKQPTT